MRLGPLEKPSSWKTIRGVLPSTQEKVVPITIKKKNTLQFQIEGEGGINEEPGKMGENNKRGGCNKREVWQKSSKLINGRLE